MIKQFYGIVVTCLTNRLGRTIYIAAMLEKLYKIRS